MAAINAAREILKVEETINKITKEMQLAQMKIKRHESKASSATFNGYTAEENADYSKQLAVLKEAPNRLESQQRLLAALQASRDAKTTYKTARVGEEGEDGCFYIDDEDLFDDMMGGDVDDDDGEEWDEGVAPDDSEMAAFASVTEHLKRLGFDPEKYAPAQTAATAPTAAADASTLLPHELKQASGGDNDILRYAKLGLLDAFRNEENIEGIDPLTFSDNNQRTCLHYAADGGNVDLVKYLLERGLNPCHVDDKGISPLDIAVLLNRRACVDLIVDHLRNKEKAFVSSSMLNPATLSATFIPAPPRFIMSKGVPPLPPRKASYGFWGKLQDTLIEGIEPTDVASPSFAAASVGAFLSSEASAMPGSFYSWLSPVREGIYGLLPRGTFAIYTPKADVCSLSSLLYGATLLAGSDRHAISNAVAMAGFVAIAPEYRKNGDAYTILGLAYTALRKKNAQVGIFTSNAASPSQLIAAVTRIKWYRRTINTIHLIDNTTPRIVAELYPDFAKYAATLRIDYHLKSLFKETNQLTLRWTNIKAGTPQDAMRYATAILKFMDAELSKVSECHLLFDGVDELVDNLLNANEVYVVGTPDRVTDVVVLAPRVSREKAPGGAMPLSTAAIHVFSLFTSLKEEARLLEMTKIAGSLVGAEVFYASNTHGLSEDNFRASMLEEQPAYGTNLFIVDDRFNSCVPRTEAKKVFVPFALL